jgi:hypothetical protein
MNLNGFAVMLCLVTRFFFFALVIIIFSWLISADGSYALKKVLIQSNEHLELVRQEIHVSSQFSHPNLLPLLEHAIIAVKVGCT